MLFRLEQTTKVALDAIQFLGGKGDISDRPAVRRLRDARLDEIGARTSEIRRMLIGPQVLERIVYRKPDRGSARQA